MSTSKNDINDLRAALFEALQAVRAGTLEVDKARGINDLAKTIVDTAKVEVDYIRATGRDHVGTGFIADDDAEGAMRNGITGIVRHRLAG